jgi:streptogramin lyase
LPSVQLPSAPDRIRSGLGAIWVSTDEGAVYRIDPRTLATTRVPRAQGVVAAGPDSLWVTIDNPATGIHRIHPTSGRILATVPVKGVRAAAVGQGALWVSTNAELYRLHPGDARVVGAPVPLEAPSVTLAVGEGGVWVGERGRETFITRFDPTP